MILKKKGLSKVSNLNYPKIVAFGFSILILFGTILLMLPISSRDGNSVGFLKALFTATSASCVTGLAVCDTYLQWTLFGQIVILLLIQIGGLGFLTILAFLSMVINRRIGLKERSLLQESVNTMYIGGIVKLTKKIITGTICIELIGAILLATRFIPRMGIGIGIFNAIFLSISAFCNAGFDLMGRYSEYSSITLPEFRSDPVIILTLCALITIGAIGFFVWDDITVNKWHFSQYKLHSKISITATLLLTIIGTPLFYIFENNNTLEGMSVLEKILCSLFSVVTPRTAGFEVVSSNDITPASTLLTILYMIIGGSSGSTAGGAKTTTFAVILLSLWSSIRTQNGINVFGRRLEDNVLKRACSVLAINVILSLVGALIICGVQPQLLLKDVLFETFSAIDTVGMTTGITRDLNIVSQITIIFLMFLGRVGSLSFALIFTNANTNLQSAQNPVEKINIG